MSYTLPSDHSQGRIRIGMSYDNPQCSGLVAVDGNVIIDQFLQADMDTVEFTYAANSVLEIAQMQGCVVNVYSVDVATASPPAYNPSTGSGADTNLALNVRSGSCQFDPCQAVPAGSAGSCAVETGNVGGGGVGGTNGIRVCGDVRSSTVGWGGEPNRAIDGNTDGNWGGGSCTHTDAAPAWWQIDLGVVAHITHVDVWHRTNCCQDRLESAHIIVSSTPDFDGTVSGVPGVTCSQLSDHTQQPEVAQCGAAAEGRYVTVDHGRGGGGSSDGIVITLCEVAVWGHIGTGGTPPITDLVPGLPSGECH